MSIASDMAQLMERDPLLRCAYCACDLALPFNQTGSGHLEWERLGWQLYIHEEGPATWEVMEGRRLAHREHVHPRSKGGADSLDNLVLACDDCNREKKARSLLLFFARRAGFPRFRSVSDNAGPAVFAAAWGG